MSRGNLDAVQRLYQAWASGDLSDTSLFDPCVVAVFPDPHPVPLYGLDAMAEYIRGLLETWDDLRFEATGYREHGDSIVVQVRRSAVGKGGGVPVADNHAFHVWTFRGGRAIRLEVFERQDDALAAVGLEPAIRGDAQLVRRFLDHARDDPDAVWGIFDDQVEWDLTDIPAAPDVPRTSYGPDAVREFFRRWIGAFDDWGYEAQEILEGPDAVVVHMHQWGRGKGSGIDVDNRFWQVWVMRKGRALRVTHHVERARAFEVAGLAP